MTNTKVLVKVLLIYLNNNEIGPDTDNVQISDKNLKILYTHKNEMKHLYYSF